MSSFKHRSGNSVQSNPHSTSQQSKDNRMLHVILCDIFMILGTTAAKAHFSSLWKTKGFLAVHWLCQKPEDKEQPDGKNYTQAEIKASHLIVKRGRQTANTKKQKKSGRQRQQKITK